MTLLPDSTWTLDNKQLGQRVHLYHRLESSNTLALSFAGDAAQHGLVILALEQTAGRGQYGRSWQAPPRSSVLLSLLLFPPSELRRPALLTAWAAVAVCDTVHQLTGFDPTIKWPNDILIDRKKVCGILIEQRTTSDPHFPLATVVGIGLNIAQTASDFEHAGLPEATSLALASGKSFPYEEVARTLLQRLDGRYDTLINGDLHSLQDSWQRRLKLLGKRVTVEGTQRHLTGRLREMSLSELTLETDAGDLVRLAPEAVRHIHS